jgi:hypothetical protein
MDETLNFKLRARQTETTQANSDWLSALFCILLYITLGFSPILLRIGNLSRCVREHDRTYLMPRRGEIKFSNCRKSILQVFYLL